MTSDEEFGQRLRSLEAKIAKLSAQLETMKSAAAAAAQPKPPFVRRPMPHYDPTANAQMPASAVQAMVAAVPDNLMRAIAGDHKTPAMPPLIGPSARKTGSGWIPERPLAPPPGIEIVDRIAEGFAEVDRRDAAKRLKEAGE
jgi:hypothetical protein